MERRVTRKAPHRTAVRLLDTQEILESLSQRLGHESSAIIRWAIRWYDKATPYGADSFGAPLPKPPNWDDGKKAQPPLRQHQRA